MVLVWQSTGFAMVIYMAGLAGVPVEVEEAAAIDGARSVAAVLATLRCPPSAPPSPSPPRWESSRGCASSIQIMALTGGGPAGATETLATQVYKQAFALGNFGCGAALALVLAAIILIFAVLQQRLTRSNPED